LRKRAVLRRSKKREVVADGESGTAGVVTSECRCRDADRRRLLSCRVSVVSPVRRVECPSCRMSVVSRVRRVECPSYRLSVVSRVRHTRRSSYVVFVPRTRQHRVRRNAEMTRRRHHTRVCSDLEFILRSSSLNECRLASVKTGCCRLTPGPVSPLSSINQKTSAFGCGTDRDAEMTVSLSTGRHCVLDVTRTPLNAARFLSLWLQ